MKSLVIGAAGQLGQDLMRSLGEGAVGLNHADIDVTDGVGVSRIIRQHQPDWVINTAAFHRVVDRAIQVWGAAGVTSDLPLQAMYTGARTLRIADGPDEVHRILIAKNVLAQYRDGERGWAFGS